MRPVSFGSLVKISQITMNGKILQKPTKRDSIINYQYIQNAVTTEIEDRLGIPSAANALLLQRFAQLIPDFDQTKDRFIPRPTIKIDEQHLVTGPEKDQLASLIKQKFRFSSLNQSTEALAVAQKVEAHQEQLIARGADIELAVEIKAADPYRGRTYKIKTVEKIEKQGG